MSSSISTIHALAGASAGAMSMTLLYPLDNLRTRLQVHHNIKIDNNDTILSNNNNNNNYQFVKNIIINDGILKLYTGLESAIVGVVASSYLYFWWYSHLKAIILKKTNRNSLTTSNNTIVAAIAGAINCTCTVPFWVVNTRSTLDNTNKSMYAIMSDILKNEGLLGLYHGYLPSLVLVINPIIQFVCYEQFIRILVKYRKHISKRSHPNRFSASDYFILGAIAKAIATVLTYPLQVVKSRLQQKNSPYKNAWHCILSMLKEEGTGSFFNGMFPKLAQTTLNAAFTFAIYEKLVRLLLRISVMFDFMKN